MRDQDWHRCICTFEVAPFPDDINRQPHYREALLRLVALINQAPETLLASYRRIPEKALATTTAQYEYLLKNGEAVSLPKETEIQLAALFHSAALVRALDKVTYDDWPSRGKLPSVKKLYCETNKAYLIPLKDGLHKASGDFSRRGLIYNRIIPDTLNGIPVNITLLSGLHSRPEGSRRYGAALFPSLGLKTAPADDGFICTGVDCPDHEDLIRSHLASAFSEACHMMVWPELTIPPEARALIAETLRSDRSLKRPTFVVAGTWHNATDGGYQNVGSLLSGTGKELLSFRKMKAFESKTLGWEQIVPGNTIEIVIHEGVITAFCICKDYCDASGNSLFSQLDVDVIVVPSYGNTTTIEGHEAMALRASLNKGSNAFVVQQTGRGAFTGQAVSPFGKIIPLTKKHVDQTAGWATYPYPPVSTDAGGL